MNDYIPKYILIFLCSFFISGCTNANEPKKDSPTVINQGNVNLPINKVIFHIDTPSLFAGIGLLVSHAAGNINFIGNEYNIGDRKSGATETFSIGIYSSSQEAHVQFHKNMLERSMQMSESQPKGIGDEVKCIGSMRDPDSSGLILLRRENVLIETRWMGTKESAYEFARKIDQILAHDDAICPKGAVVPVPTIDIAVPDSVPLHGTTKITYRVEDGLKVMVATPDSSSKVWTSTGIVSYWAKDLGKQEVELRFATQDNVIFSKTITINVVPKQEYLDSLNQRPWDIYGRFYLKKDEKADFLSIPFAKREIIEMDSGTVHDFKDDKLKDAKKRDLEEMKSVVQEKWLPEPQFIQPGFNVWKPVNHEVYTARFETKGLHILYLGKPGESLWLYIEQPDGAAALPALSDVIQPAVLKAAAGKIALQTFTGHRYRSVNSKGPWQPVSILVVKIDFAAGLTIDSFGYDLPHTK